MKIKDITILSLLVSVLFVQEQMLTFIPNVQLSTLLIVIYSKLFDFKKVTMLISVHVLLDNIYMGSLSPLYTPSMFFAWMLIPITLKTVFRNVNSEKGLAFFGFFFGFVYGWVFIPASMILTEIPFVPYLLADIPFEIAMAISNFVSILWLYKPLYNTLNNLINNNYQYNKI